MRNLKKVVSLLVVFAMAISFTSAFAATFTDVDVDSDAYAAVETLSALGIINGYEDGTFRPEQTISRAEFAAVVCRARGLNEVLAKTDTQFTDVKADHWASGAVKMAADLNIVNGMGDGTFKPDDPVTYEQALKMIMVGLGYAPMASAQEYPTGYIVAATTSGVSKGVPGNVGEAAPRGLVARLLYNAIDTPIMEQIVYGNEILHQIQDGSAGRAYKTLMSEYLGVTKLKGQVSGNKYTNLNSTQTISNTVVKDETVKIAVDGNFKSQNRKYVDVVTNTKASTTLDFKIGKTDAPKYLGQRVIFYVLEESTYTDDTIVSIVPESGKNVTVKMNMDQFEEYDSANKNWNYFRDKDRDTRTTNLKIANNPSVIYNNRAYTKGLVELVREGLVDKELDGSITLIDSNNSGLYDVVFVEAPYVLVVDSINTSTGRIIAKNSQVGSLTLNTSTYTDLIYKITKDGKEIELKDLQEWDVLCVIHNDTVGNGDYYEIEVVSQIIEGEVTELSGNAEEGNLEFVIDGTAYEPSNDGFQVEAIKAGASGRFFIDKYGKIAAYEKIGTSGLYGFVTAWITDGAFSKVTSLQMLNSDGDVVVYNFARNVTVVNEKRQSKTYTDGDFRSDKEETVEDLGLTGQLIKYELNSNNQVYRIEMAKVTGADDNIFTRVSGADNLDYTFVYRETGSRFTGNGASYRVDETTKAFYMVPAEDGEGWDVNASEVRKGDNFADDEEYKELAFYDKDSNSGICKIVVIFNGEVKPIHSRNLAVAISYSTTNNADGDRVYKIKYLQDGETKSTLTSINFSASQLPSVGDGMQFSLNAKDEIDGIDILYTIESAGIKGEAPVVELLPDGIELQKNVEIYYGPVADIYGSTITLGDVYDEEHDSWTLDGEEVEIGVNSKVNVYEYNFNRSSASRIVASDFGCVDAPYGAWALDGAFLSTDDTDGDPTFEAPAAEARDHVFAKEYDGDITDIVVIKAYPYVFAKNK